MINICFCSLIPKYKRQPSQLANSLPSAEYYNEIDVQCNKFESVPTLQLRGAANQFIYEIVTWGIVSLIMQNFVLKLRKLDVQSNKFQSVPTGDLIIRHNDIGDVTDGGMEMLKTF